MVKDYQLWINGKTVASQNERIDSINPWTNQCWATIPDATKEDVDRACEAASAAFQEWGTMHPSERAACLNRLADLIEENAEHLAQTEVQDNGKLFAEMHGQVLVTAQHYRYFAGFADKCLGSVVPVDKPDFHAYTLKEPLGVVVAIIPWNSPLLIATWKCAPALAAGNTVILKPSEFASASAFELAKLTEKAGFPPGVFNVVSGRGDASGAYLVEHPAVAKVTFTGGTDTGRKVYQTAAKSIKKVGLELGGKSPHIIFEDANLENAVKGAISGIFAASGQTCIAGSRLLVQESIYDNIVEKLVSLAKTAVLGNPMNKDTNVGPVTTPPQHEKIASYLKIAKEEGAECVLGGNTTTVENSPWFVEPTIFAGVNNQMRIAQEEVFGPVLSVIPFKDEDEAVNIANDTIYGLASGLWTENLARAHRVPKRLQAGVVWVNTYRVFSYMMPFGGYKQSGIGRESGHLAIQEYLQDKSVWINMAEDFRNPFVMG
ncbi:MAG: carnitine dehydratase [Legionellales bacterium]|nr:carnitine dehydratase [Legionellales bacterium]